MCINFQDAYHSSIPHSKQFVYLELQLLQYINIIACQFVCLSVLCLIKVKMAELIEPKFVQQLNDPRESLWA